MAIPTQDNELVAWGGNFDGKVSASPITYSLTAAQALSFHNAYNTYVDSVNVVEEARAAGMRSKLLTATKESNKESFLVIARELYGFVQDSTSVSVANKKDVGVNPKDKLPSPIPAPSEAPAVDILSVTGRTVAIRVHEEGSTRRGKPAGCEGAIIVSFVGAEPPPAGSAEWKFEGNTTRTTREVAFDASVPAGAQVWISACWFNNKMEAGPWATPVSTNIAGTIAA